MSDACQLSARYARHTADGYLRLGLQMVALGCAIGLLYCLVYAYNALALRTQRAPLGPVIVTSAVLPVTCCALLVIGSTIGGWARGWSERGSGGLTTSPTVGLAPSEVL